MKFILLQCLLFLGSFTAISQEAADTIVNYHILEEVTVAGKKKKNIKEFKTTGFPAYDHFDQGEKILHLIKGYPEGRIEYIEFFFNTGLPNMFKKKLNIYYRDVEVKLLLHKVVNDSLIGESLLPGDTRFIVPKEHDGALRIPVSQFNIHEKQIFVGLEITGQTVKDQANFYLRMHERKDAVGYTYSSFLKSWRKQYYPFVFKLRLGIMPNPLNR